MKRILLSILFLLISSQVSWALIVTDNVDKDKFEYEVPYHYATRDVAASTTAVEMPTSKSANETVHNFYFVAPRDGMVVGLSISASNQVTTGAATFDVTINGTVTGIQAVIEAQSSANVSGGATSDVVNRRAAIGTSGYLGNRYSFIRHDRSTQIVERGFRLSADRASTHGTDYPYGKATDITAGNRIGLRLTTSAGITPTLNSYEAIVYVLE